MHFFTINRLVFVMEKQYVNCEVYNLNLYMLLKLISRFR